MSFAWLVLSVASWFATTTLFSTFFNSAFMVEFKDFTSAALGLTLVRFVGSALLGLSANALGLVLDQPLARDDFAQASRAFLVPSLLLATANFFNSIALGLTGITVTYVTKSCIPLVTVAVCVWRGERVALNVLATLFPIVVGVALSSWSDSQFHPLGLAAAIISTVAQTLLNMQSKHALAATGLTGAQAQTVMVTNASALVCAAYAVFTVLKPADVHDDFPQLLQRARTNERAMFIFMGAPVAYHVEYVLNFVVTGKVSAVVFSVIDVMRRLATVVAGAIIFSKPLSPLNFAGCVMALGGVLAFTITNR